jgi:hypothetical protein
MSMKSVRRSTRRRQLSVTLDGEAALAFERAREAATEVGACGEQASRFAEWLLGRAAESYALAAKHDRERFWKFDLQPRTFEESVAFDICHSLAENPEQFPLLKRKRAPHEEGHQ